jgi:hypothetical protein
MYVPSLESMARGPSQSLAFAPQLSTSAPNTGALCNPPITSLGNSGTQYAIECLSLCTQLSPECPKLHLQSVSQVVSKELNVRDIVDGSLRKAGHVCLEPNSLTFDLSMCNVAPRTLRTETMVLGVSSCNTHVFASHWL